MSFAVELRLGDRCLLLQAPVQRVTTESERLFHPSPPHPMGPCRGGGDLAAQQGTGSGHLGRLNAASRGNVPTHAARRGHARQGPRPRVGGYGVGQLRSSAGGAGRVRPVDGCFHGGRHGGYDSSPAHLIDQATNPQTSKAYRYIALYLLITKDLYREIDSIFSRPMPAAAGGARWEGSSPLRTRRAASARRRPRSISVRRWLSTASGCC